VAACSTLLAFRFCCYAALLTVPLLLAPANEPPPDSLTPDKLFALVSKIRHSDRHRALQLAAQGYEKSQFAESWRWRFRVLHAELLLDKVDPSEASQLLGRKPPAGLPPAEVDARLASLQGYVAQRANKWQDAERSYEKARGGLAVLSNDPCWGAELLIQHQAQTLRMLEKFSRLAAALKKSLPFAEACPDKAWRTLIPFVQANAFNDQSYYENAVSSFQQCVALARKNNIQQLISNTLGNIALAYYNLGDTEKALSYFDQSDAEYRSRRDQLTPNEKDDWGVHRGHRARTYLALKKYDEAANVYRESIQTATEYGNSAFAARWRTELASLYIEEGDYPSAEPLIAQAIQETNFETDFASAALARLDQARLARLEGNLKQARAELEALQPEIDKSNDDKMIWQAHIERAQTFAALGLLPQARGEFEAALNTSNAAREKIKTPDYRLTYFSQLLGIYQSYVQFLAAHDQPNNALRVAESGHARLLAEKLNDSQSPASQSSPTTIARAKNAVILSYSVAPEHSYGWATTRNASRMFPLLGADLAKLIDLHNQRIMEQRSLREDQGGSDLYKILIGPVADLIPPDANVIVIPDGPLANLNFETLIPPVSKGSAPRYWLESVVLTIAPSLTLLHPAVQRAFDPASLLLVGNAVQADPQLKPLTPMELEQIDSLYRPRCHWLFKSQATPDGFLHANPAQYSLIHFSTHAMPNPQSPLDSYLVLSPETNGEYKLYAHDLANLKLNANLVTLSACQSAGSKNVPGEGLVGLTWAVMSAGAQNVIASLWSVGVTPTSGLMAKFYKHLHAGETPAQALHAAKLEMIKARSNPYGWAAFQLYSL